MPIRRNDADLFAHRETRLLPKVYVLEVRHDSDTGGYVAIPWTSLGIRLPIPVEPYSKVPSEDSAGTTTDSGDGSASLVSSDLVSNAAFDGEIPSSTNTHETYEAGKERDLITASKGILCFLIIAPYRSQVIGWYVCPPASGSGTDL